MNRVIGFMMFWIGFGILIGLLLSDAVCCVLISAACLYYKLIKNRLQTNRFAVYIKGGAEHGGRRHFSTSPLRFCGK